MAANLAHCSPPGPTCNTHHSKPQQPAYFSTIIKTPLPNGYIRIELEHQVVVRLRFLIDETSLQTSPLDKSLPSNADQLIVELRQYFSDPTARFNVPRKASGTSFQHRVWQAINAIPCGETRSYGQLAKQLHTSPRAVGGACRANPLPLIVPCHRVISASGGNGGFLGQPATQGMSADIKHWLLCHEQH